MHLVAADIGGTNARFAIAEVAAGRVISLGPVTKLHTADHPSFETAWKAFAAQTGAPLPRAAAIAFAGPVDGETLQLTNSHWVLKPGLIKEHLGVDAFVVVNDFAAVAHAVAHCPPGALAHLFGPARELSDTEAVCVMGPGTGLGVAQLLGRAPGYSVRATEAGHIAFAPLDAFEDGLLDQLRAQLGRVSAERVASGPGLRAIYNALAQRESRPPTQDDDAALWGRALARSDSLAAAALDRFCMILGAVAGDLALAQGASAVVLAGGVGHRIADRLPASGFAERFIAKGRFEGLMARMPVKLMTLDEPGLYGAAAAFAVEHAPGGR